MDFRSIRNVYKANWFILSKTSKIYFMRKISSRLVNYECSDKIVLSLEIRSCASCEKNLIKIIT